MASRMTISSLLCDDQPHPPQQQQQQQQKQSLNQYTPSTKSPFIGLEALVHAATEERRRLSGGSATTDSSRSTHHQDHRSPPFHRHHQQLPPSHENNSLRSPTYSPTRHRHRIILDDHHPLQDDLSHRPSPGFFPLPSDHEQRQQQQQRIHHHQQLDFQRQQRQHHEQLLLQEQHQIQLIAHERHLLIPDRSPPEPTIPSFSQPPSRLPSMPLQIHHHHHHLPSSPINNHSLPRNSLPDHNTQSYLNLITPTSDHSPKKPRYSHSPLRSLPLPEDDSHHDPPKILHVDSPPPVAKSPHRPGSGPARKQINLADLITSDRSPSELSHPALSPLGKRSPPGSISGRAKAARKSEEDFTDQVPLQERGRQPPIPSQDERKRPKEDRQKPRSQPAPEPLPKSKEPIHRHPPLPPPPPTLAKPREDDAHEWFLEHFDEYPSKRPHSPPPQSSPLVSSPIPAPPVRPPEAPVLKKSTPSPTTMPDAASALEQELEALMAEVPVVVSKVEPDLDMDVDLAVTELVAETLDDPQPPKREQVGMEVDDELLSLVDDRPPPPPQTSRRSSHLSSSVKPPSQRTVSDSASPTLMSAASPPGFLSPAVRPSSTRPASERGSMPPPPTSVASKADKAGSVPVAVKKKPSKPPAKPKATVPAPAKPRPKSGPKAKPRGSENSVPVPTKPTKPATAASKKTTSSRSRSASVMPGGSVGPETEKQEEEEEEEQHEDDKLYCVCKTKYDEDRFMIACDRCDEWYHTQCVSMLDREVDLVDQFICPPCVEKHPHLPLRTTYKQRCLYGLKHADPGSSKACHKPARGIFSKYCSDECGVKHMQTRVEAWEKKGGKKDKLWESVKNAEKREGVVVLAENASVVAKMEVDDQCKKEELKPAIKKSKVEREVERLNLLLDQVVMLREEVKKGMEVVVWREKLLELATERAEQVGQCGWDQRLCFGDEEWSDFGAGVLESYEEAKLESSGEHEDMQVDGAAEEDGEWWCPGKSMCDRHNGWQAVRHRDVCKEKEKKEDALLNLTTREREIRKRIEDIIDPHGHNCTDVVTKSPLKPSNNKLTNGHTKGKMNGDVTKKGKKRKAPS